MKFYSTSNKNIQVSFEEAVRQGMAADGGLFVPETIDQLPKNFWRNFSQKSFNQISVEVASHFLKGALPEEDLKKIIQHSLVVDAPLVKVESTIFALELFHGPTLAFKDFGARFLAEVLDYYIARKQEEITVLVATSGDTGSAVAHGFFNLRGIKVVVLYPSGKVTESQEKQFTTLGGNVTALEVAGTFDDCQRMVKQAFSDEDIRLRRTLTSANSINVARLLPQMFYYFRAFQQIPHLQQKLVIAVPSGNFGNLTAGLWAKKMGLPVDRFVAATNVNNVVPEYLRTQIFKSMDSKATISNAMDVGDPSNFARMIELYNRDHVTLTNDVSGYEFTDDETVEAIREVYRTFKYIMDPHGAVGYLGLKKYLASSLFPSTGIFLETAHPAKFKETVEKSITTSIQLPERLLNLMSKEKKSILLKNDFKELKEYLLKSA